MFVIRGVVGVFAVAAAMDAFGASANLVFATLALGGLTILVEHKLRRRD